MRNIITIRHSVLITRQPEAVWEYTQDYGNRPIWDATVLQANVLQTTPNRIVALKMKGGTEMTFVYKTDERPFKTSLATSDVHSPFIVSAGGSWTYEAQSGGTLWTQTNSIILTNKTVLSMLLPVIKWLFHRQTVKAMKKVKLILERKPDNSPFNG